MAIIRAYIRLTKFPQIKEKKKGKKTQNLESNSKLVTSVQFLSVLLMA